MPRMWNLAGLGYRAIRRMSDGAQRGAAASSQRRSLRRAARIAGSGVLWPGDPDPSPTGPTDYYDYRGVATMGQLGALRDEPYSLGKVIAARRGESLDIGIPSSVLRRHAVVVGPTGSGKTKSVLIPWIATALRDGHSVVAVDVSGDLLDDLATHRAATGPMNAEVAMWDFSRPSSSVAWNWLTELKSEESTVSAVEAINGRQSPSDSQPFFHQRDARFLRGLLEVVTLVGTDPRPQDLLSIVRDGYRLRSLAAKVQGTPAAGRLHDLVAAVGSSRYAELSSGLLNGLEMWDHPGLAAVTARQGLRFDDVLAAPSLLVIGAPLHAGKLSEVSSALILSQLVQRLYLRFGQADGRQVFLVIDEAARVANRLNLEELTSVARRAGVSVLLALQDVGQFPDENERLAILGNCATYISLPGRSVANATYLAGRLGTRPQSTMSLSEDPASLHRPGVSVSSHTEMVPVLGDREIMDPPFGERCGVVHCQPVCSRPFLVDLGRPEFV